MCQLPPVIVRRVGRGAAFAAAVLLGVATAHAQSVGSDTDETIGRIDFDDADLPPAKVEVNLSQGMLSNLLGIGDAAIAGAIEALSKLATESPDSEATRITAQQLASARQITQLVGQVVRGVRVRVYEDLPDSSELPETLVSRFDEQLRKGNWETVVRVHDGDETVQVSVRQHAGAIRGALVIVVDGDDIVLANVVCDVSPESVKKLSAAATQIGLENGLQQMFKGVLKVPNR